MKPQIDIVAPYRIVDRVPNTGPESNALFRPIFGLLRSFFREIIHDPALLRMAYVSGRYSASDAGSGTMNNRYPNEYVDNMVSRWSTDFNSFVPAETLSEAIARICSRIPDRAQLFLLDQVMRLSKNLQAILLTDSHFLTVPRSPANRMFFVQGGIGTGKTTMLHHFTRVLLPDLITENLLPIRLCPLLIDLNEPSCATSEATVWGVVLRKAAEAVTQFMDDIPIPQKWTRITEPLLKTKTGSWTDDVATLKDTDRQSYMAERIRECRDSLTFLLRASRFLASQTTPIHLLFVLDNLDWQTPVERQIFFIDKLKELLVDVMGIGIIAVREYTLGTMATVDSFASNLYLDRMHITTPVIGQVVQKRFNEVIGKLYAQTYNDKTFLVGDASHSVTVSIETIKEVLYATQTAFREEQQWADKSPNAGSVLNRGMSLPELLHGSTNSNTRMALDLIVNALESWALPVHNTFAHFLHTRDTLNRRELPPLTFDELLRLGMVGKKRYFATENDKHDVFFNVFGWGRQFPDPKHGQFPALIKIRLMQFLFHAGDGVRVSDIEEAFAIFEAYRGRPIRDLLERFMEEQFIESHDGRILERVHTVHYTRKLLYYLNILVRNLVYIENARNDCVIEYSAPPHECRGDLIQDVRDVLYFIHYIYLQETAECGYIKAKDERQRTGRIMNTYKRMLNGRPIACTMLDSIGHRVANLWNKVNQNLYDKAEAGKLIGEYDRDLRQMIVDSIVRGDLPYSSEHTRLVSPLQHLR